MLRREGDTGAAPTLEERIAATTIARASDLDVEWCTQPSALKHGFGLLDAALVDHLVGLDPEDHLALRCGVRWLPRAPRDELTRVARLPGIAQHNVSPMLLTAGEAVWAVSRRHRRELAAIVRRFLRESEAP